LVRSGLGSGWILRERLIEIAKTLRRFPWIVDVVRQKPVGILHPYTVEVYVARDGSEACLSLNPPKAYCAQNGAVKEVRLEMEFSRYETYEDKTSVQTKRPAGIHHGGRGICEDTLGKIDEILPPQNQPFCRPPS
jgi:hypothetical protein